MNIIALLATLHGLKGNTAALLLGRSLVRAWQEGDVPSDEAMERDSFHERMKRLVSWRAAEWPYEYQYWKDTYGL